MIHDESDDSSDAGQYEEHGMKSNKTWVPAVENPNYFEELPPEEIYDSFFSIRRMGFIANRIIRKLNETKHIVSSKILEKRKKLRQLQRKQFEQLSPAGVEYLKVLLKMEMAALKNSAQAVEASLNPNASVKARLAHLAIDPSSASILSRIYATNTNANQRSLDLWKSLATEFVNSGSWAPRKIIDERLFDVDPSHPPDEKYSPETLRSIFSRLRIDYTRTLLKFQTTPKTATSKEGMDSEFFERFAKHDKGIYYIYQLFQGRGDQECLLVDPALSRTDIELDQALNALGTYPASAYNQAGVGMKRDRDVTVVGEEDALHIMDTMDPTSSSSAPKRYARAEEALTAANMDEVAWHTTVRKDHAISNYYTRVSINNDIRFCLDLLTKETVGEAMKKNIKNKINTLLLKKVEDRYDDLNF